MMPCADSENLNAVDERAGAVAAAAVSAEAASGQLTITEQLAAT